MDRDREIETKCGCNEGLSIECYGGGRRRRQVVGVHYNNCLPAMPLWNYCLPSVTLSLSLGACALMAPSGPSCVPEMEMISGANCLCHVTGWCSGPLCGCAWQWMSEKLLLFMVRLPITVILFKMMASLTANCNCNQLSTGQCNGQPL